MRPIELMAELASRRQRMSAADIAGEFHVSRATAYRYARMVANVVPADSEKDSLPADVWIERISSLRRRVDSLRRTVVAQRQTIAALDARLAATQPARKPLVQSADYGCQPDPSFGVARL